LWSRKAAARVAAPLAAAILPWRLNRALSSPQPGKTFASVSGASARWFFGRSLTFWTSPQKLGMRLDTQMSDGGKHRLRSERFIDHSDWSNAVRPEAKLIEHKTMVQLVRYRSAYPEMPVFRELLQRAKKGGPARRLQMHLTTEEMIHAYFRHYLDLIEDIEATGMKDRYALGPYFIPDGKGGSRLSPHQSRNIGVAVAPDNSLVRFLGGRHRLAIAQALGLTLVPVELRLVHADWMLSEVERTGLTPVEAIRRFVGCIPDEGAADRSRRWSVRPQVRPV